MNGKNILEGQNGPVTQSIPAVKNLLAFVGRASDPLPTFVELAGGVRLTLSSKKDGYYTTTPTACSCPGFTYHRSCKHVNAKKGATAEDSLRSYEHFRPVMPEDMKARGVA